MYANHRGMNKFYGSEDEKYLHLRLELEAMYERALGIHAPPDVVRMKNGAQSQLPKINTLSDPLEDIEPRKPTLWTQDEISIPSPSVTSTIGNETSAFVAASATDLATLVPSTSGVHSRFYVRARPTNLKEAMDLAIEEASRRRQSSSRAVQGTTGLLDAPQGASAGVPHFMATTREELDDRPNGCETRPTFVKGYDWLLANANEIIEGRMPCRIALAGFTGNG